MQNFHELGQPTAIQNYKTRFQAFSPERESQGSEPSEVICHFFISAVRQYSPQRVLQYFKNIFFLQRHSLNGAVEQALLDLVAFDRKEEFLNTLNRSCYILINNWSASKEKIYHSKLLVELLPEAGYIDPKNCSFTQKIKTWLKIFVENEQYQTLQSLIAQDVVSEKLSTSSQGAEKQWTNRYSYYLVKHQANNTSNIKEHRAAAKSLSKQIKEQFKFDLAMYFVYSQLSAPKKQVRKNPTTLTPEILNLIQKTLSGRKNLNYKNLANIFLKQVEGIRYKDLKKSILNYLKYSLHKQNILPTWLEAGLSEFLATLYEEHDERPWDDYLLLRTCNRLIEYLTKPNFSNPSNPATILAVQKNYLTWTVVVLKILLICNDSYNHLIACMVDLIQQNEARSMSECQWLIRFLDTLNVVLAIAYENPRHNLLSLPKQEPIKNTSDPLPHYDVRDELALDEFYATTEALAGFEAN
ncbi:hypothetical protein [Lusitaniella coriacea]|uniref:hypothetical protein n=1 Tax=Lusitaniella coriacea TaxID=1983105 RepID=UPI003CED1FC2